MCRIRCMCGERGYFLSGESCATTMWQGRNQQHALNVASRVKITDEPVRFGRNRQVDRTACRYDRQGQRIEQRCLG